MIQAAKQEGRYRWLLFIPPVTCALIGASLHAWGMFGLDNTPPTWSLGAHAERLRYGEATYAYAAGNLAFAFAFLTGALCLLLFLITRSAPGDE